MMKQFKGEEQGLEFDGVFHRESAEMLSVHSGPETIVALQMSAISVKIIEIIKPEDCGYVNLPYITNHNG